LVKNGYVSLDDLTIDCQYLIWRLKTPVAAFCNYVGLDYEYLGRMMQGTHLSAKRRETVAPRVAALKERVENLSNIDASRLGKLFKDQYSKRRPTLAEQQGA